MTVTSRWVRLIALGIVFGVPCLSYSGAAASDTSLAITLSPASGPIGSVVTVSGSGAPPGSTVWVYWRPWASGQPCAPFPTGGYAVSGYDVGADDRFVATSRTEPLTDDYPTVQGVRYMAAVGSAADVLTGSGPVRSAMVSNVACFTFRPPAPVRYFPQTGFVVANGFLRYWQQFGGLATFGYPLTPEYHSCNYNTPPWCGTVQYFERARFEWHPGSDPARYDVELSSLGYELAALSVPELKTGPFTSTYATDVTACGPGGTSYPNDRTTGGQYGLLPGLSSCLYFPATGHRVSNGFLAYWEKFGGLVVFGYPISEEFHEKNLLDTGQVYTVQYFQRARFEWHPGSDPARYDVELGRLGARIQSIH